MQAFPIPEPKDPSARDLSSIRFAEDLRRFMATSPFFLPARTGKEAQSTRCRDSAHSHAAVEIDRYSDKYVAHLQAQDESGKIHAIVTGLPRVRPPSDALADLSFFPEELHSVYNTSKARRHASSAPPLHAFSFTDTLAKVRDLERGEDGGVEVAAGEEGAEDEDGDGEKTRDGEEDDEAVFEEEDLEDETDYNLSYFDNGEEYGGADYDDGDGMRAPHETQCNA